MDFVKSNFQFLVLLILAGIILLERSCTPATPPAKPTVTTTIDTSWKHLLQPIVNVHPTVTTYVPYAQTPGKPAGRDTLYLPSAVDSILRIQYKALRDSLLSSNIYSQTLKSDSSSVAITDTISQNHITGRGYRFDLKYPVITRTTVIKEPYVPKDQFYIGGGLAGSQQQFLQGFKAGLLFKTKSDQIYKVGAQINTDGGISYDFESYWKIKLHK